MWCLVFCRQSVGDNFLTVSDVGNPIIPYKRCYFVLNKHKL
jgi:hypothetical protein